VLPAPSGAIHRRTGALVTRSGNCRALRTRHGGHGCDLLGLRGLFGLLFMFCGRYVFLIRSIFLIGVLATKKILYENSHGKFYIKTRA
jgi:hypothetical protein